jgi:hypothetical protein
VYIAPSRTEVIRDTETVASSAPLKQASVPSVRMIRVKFTVKPACNRAPVEEGREDARAHAASAVPWL